MNRFDGMALRMLLPGAAWLLISWMAVEVSAGLNNSPYTAPLAQGLRWVPTAISAFGIGLFRMALFRLWRWHRGQGVLCDCGGVLGAEINGRFGHYRRCLACRRNVNCRDYQ
jgi:hypothetical protein